MSGSWTETLRNELSDKRFRDAYVAEDIRTGLAFQIRAMRESRGWSQTELGRKAGKPQSVVARLEDPDYGRFSLRTLLDLASAFDVALLVRFVSFSELIQRNRNLSPKALAVSGFTEERANSNHLDARAGSSTVTFPPQKPTEVPFSETRGVRSSGDKQPPDDEKPARTGNVVYIKKVA